MAVYDLDLFYARRFADVMNQKENIPFAVMAFTSLERLRQYAGGHSIEILLVSNQVNRDEICDLGIGQVITLTEGEKKEGDKDYPSVYKYQSSSDIIRVNTRWGITIAVAKPEPICSAVDAPLPAAPDQYVAEYIRYSAPNINEISRHLLNFCFIHIPPKLTAKPNFIKKPWAI